MSVRKYCYVVFQLFRMPPPRAPEMGGYGGGDDMRGGGGHMDYEADRGYPPAERYHYQVSIHASSDSDTLLSLLSTHSFFRVWRDEPYDRRYVKSSVSISKLRKKGVNA